MEKNQSFIKTLVIIAVIIIVGWFAFKYVRRYIGTQVAQKSVQTTQNMMNK